MRSRLRRKLTPIVSVLVFFAVWEAICWIFRIPSFLLPKPSEALMALIENWSGIWPNALHTLLTTLAGFAIAVAIGVVLGVAVGASALIYDAVNPLLIGFNAVPKVALVPILVLWFGIGTVPAVVTAFLTAFFPIVVNVAMGIATVEPELNDVLHSLGASRLDVLRKVGIPRALPYFFASLKVAVTLAFVGTVLSETVASNRGIGTVMMMASANFDVALAFAGLFALALLGVLLYAVFALIEERVCGWANRKTDLGAA